jgi:hypothetical protein
VQRQVRPSIPGTWSCRTTDTRVALQYALGIAYSYGGSAFEGLTVILAFRVFSRWNRPRREQRAAKHGRTLLTCRLLRVAPSESSAITVMCVHPRAPDDRLIGSPKRCVVFHASFVHLVPAAQASFPRRVVPHQFGLFRALSCGELTHGQDMLLPYRRPIEGLKAR